MMKFKYICDILKILFINYFVVKTQIHDFLFNNNLCIYQSLDTCDITTSYIDELNNKIKHNISKLLKSKHFRYFKINFDKKCQFWDAEQSCYSENCAVEILNSHHQNLVEFYNKTFIFSVLEKVNYKTETTQKLKKESDFHSCSEFEYCHIDDESNCVYVDLIKNLETFTGYGGRSSNRIWNSIYLNQYFKDSTKSLNTLNKFNEEDLLFKVISGMQSSISTHLSYFYIDPHTKKFVSNLSLFMEKVGFYKERLLNLYFNYALIAESIKKLTDVVSIEEIFFHDSKTKQKSDDFSYEQKQQKKKFAPLKNITSELKKKNLLKGSFNYSKNISDDFKQELRQKFKNISALMDCVECEKCKVWGKLQVIGYATALKLLLEFESPNDLKLLKFRRVEFVSLFNTFDKLSKAIEYVNEFKNLHLKNLNNKKNNNALGSFILNNNYNKFVQLHPMVLVSNSKLKKINNYIPEKSDNSVLKKQTSFASNFLKELKIAYSDVFNAFKFILISYKNLPSSFFKVLLLNLNYYWNIFIGNPRFDYYEEKLKLKSYSDNYKKLFIA